MRILILSQWFQPEPTFKGLPLAKALQANGHAVEVLTGFPNYPGGKLYPGYKLRLWKREVMEGIRVIRVILFPSHDRSALRRVFNYISFGLSTLLFGSLLIKEPDVVYAFNLVTLGPAARLIKLRFGASIILDIQDLWPDSVVESGMITGRISRILLKSASNLVYRGMDHLIVLSPTMKSELMKRRINGERISVVYNWCEDHELGYGEEPADISAFPALSGRFVVMYAGNLGVLQKLDTVLAAAGKIKNIEPNIVFVFVGDGVDRSRLEKIAREKVLSNVFFWKRQAPNRMPAVYRTADVMLVHLKDSYLFRMTIPSKIQAYMASGKPIIAGIKGDAADLVRLSGAGIVVDPEKPDEISRAILDMFRMPKSKLAEMGIVGREYYRKYLDMNTGIGQIEQIMIAAMNGKTVQRNITIGEGT
jgi:colanic acid biosynthesis glycosyl transferase WcaI